MNYKTSKAECLSTTKNKALMLGKKLTKLDNNIWLLENNESIVVISDKQLALPVNSSNLFDDKRFNSIDLRDVDTSIVVYMNDMFKNCKAKIIVKDKSIIKILDSYKNRTYTRNEL